MKDYGTFLIAFSLCIAGCASTDGTPSTGTSGVNTGSAGMTATMQPAAAGMSTGTTTTGTTGTTGSAGKPATAGTAGSSAVTTGTGTAGSSAAAAGSSGGATMMSTTPAAPGSWRAAYLAIFDASVSMCAQCHAAGGLLSPPDFSTPDKAYESLVNKDSSSNPQAQCGGKGKYIVPGNCEESLLYNKLSQDTPKCGRRMPPSSDAMPMRIATDKLDMLCAWIKAGAKND